MLPRPAPAVLALALAVGGCSTDEGAPPDAGYDAAPSESARDAASTDDDAAPTDGDAATAGYTARIEPIPESIRDEMIGRSWHPELACPAFDDLRLLTLPHWGFDGRIATGELVVAASVADDVAAAFGQLHDARFPIAHMVRVDAYDGSDDASMADNNTSAFNCRAVTGGSSLSQHSYGTAIDINPVQNPYLSGDLVLPDIGEEYLDRGDARPGMIVRPGAVVTAFESIGWQWGGEWTSPIDYQHLSQTGS